VVPAGEAPAGAAPSGAAPVVTAASAAATALAGNGAVGNGGAVAGAPGPAQAAPASSPPAPARRRVVKPIEPLPTEQAAAASLRGKGLGGPPPSAPLTYSGPREDGGTETRRSGGAGATTKQGAATATGSKEPGRNAPCPCGSGKKYKVCHGRPGAV
jgi:preprotein translocase subunit SecA